MAWNTDCLTKLAGLFQNPFQSSRSNHTLNAGTTHENVALLSQTDKTKLHWNHHPTNKSYCQPGSLVAFLFVFLFVLLLSCCLGQLHYADDLIFVFKKYFCSPMWLWKSGPVWRLGEGVKGIVLVMLFIYHHWLEHICSLYACMYPLAWNLSITRVKICLWDEEKKMEALSGSLALPIISVEPHLIF